jgi:hypothetical protein
MAVDSEQWARCNGRFEKGSGQGLQMLLLWPCFLVQEKSMCYGGILVEDGLRNICIVEHGL